MAQLLVTSPLSYSLLIIHTIISHILRRWRELQNSYTKIVLTVRNAKFGSSKGPRPPIAQKLCFTHSGTAPRFQEDPGFWSAEQLEPDKSMSKVRGKLKSAQITSAEVNSRRPSPPLTQIWPHSKIRTCLQVTWHGPARNSRASHCDTATSRSFPLASITKRLQVSYHWTSYKLVILLFSGLSIAHTRKKKVSMYYSLLILIILYK